MNSTFDSMMKAMGFERVTKIQACATCKYGMEKKAIADLWCDRHKHEVPHASSCRGWADKEMK